jgi:hypothetical protein
MFVRMKFLVSAKLTAAKALTAKAAVEGGLAIAAWATGLPNEGLVQTSLWCQQWLTLLRNRC